MDNPTLGRQKLPYTPGIADEPASYSAEMPAPTPAIFPLDPAIFGPGHLEDDAKLAGGEWTADPANEGAIAWTMFDSPGSDDNTLTILLERENIGLTPSQSLVRIVSHDRTDNTRRTYLGIVTKGPFAEPDGLRADAPLVVTTTMKGMVFTPQYHGRCQVELLGEEIEGQIMPPRFRPLPKSAVWVLNEAETAHYLKVDGDIRLGRASGHANIGVGIPSERKSVLPRHTGILGTTGGGKSTTVSRLICEAQAAGYAVVVLDVEGEYTYLAEPTTDPTMLTALQKRGLSPKGLDKPYLLHLVGRETANPDYKLKRAFSLQFSSLSPYFLKEILDLNEAQEIRFRRAYDWAKLLLRDVKIYPVGEVQEQESFNLDEFETGWPCLRLEHLLDVTNYYLRQLQKGSKERAKSKEADDTEVDETIFLYTPQFKANRAKLAQRIRKEGTDNEASWLALYGRLNRLHRLKIFDRDHGEDGKTPLAPLDYSKMLEPGRVYIVDLSDTDSPELNNLVITEVLRGIQKQQDAAYERFEKDRKPLTKVMIVIEEAHEFLSESRISRMPLLFQQVARIAKRGRKRWLSLVFVTQLPQHLPRELLGLINNYVLHKINDAATVNLLQKTIAGIDESLWKRLPALAPGQAICSFTHMARPLLVAIDPATAKLRMID